jgi:DNA invertase Pin-like site-specific DNA recombinase
MKAIIYLRKSTDREDKQVQSLEAQQKWCREYCEMHGFDVVKEISESKSAKQP